MPSSLVQHSCRVRVRPNRVFDAFVAGDEGVVLRLHAETENCEVLFDGCQGSVLVACRHLVEISQGAERQLPATRCTDKGEAKNGDERNNGELKYFELGDTRSWLSADTPLQLEVVGAKSDEDIGAISQPTNSEGAVALLGPVEPAYDGLSKWKGCALALDGCFYCAPHAATSVLVFQPHGQTLAYIDGAGSAESKWSGIAAGVDGRLYCAPCNASTVLVIDPTTKSISHIEGAGEETYKWSGIVAASDGLLYCAPSKASTVLVIDPRKKQLFHIEGAGSGGSKWAGICEGPDWRLYCAPSMATAVLVVDPRRKSLSRIEGAVDISAFKYKWSGVTRGCDHRMYCSPFNASTVLVIDPMLDELCFIGGAGLGECKWNGLAAGLDGRLYCVPSRACKILVIDPDSESLDFDFEHVGRGNSKWSGLCVSLDHWLYCVPYNSSHVLAIKGGRRGSDQRPARPRPGFGGLFSGDDPDAEDKNVIVFEFSRMLELPVEHRVSRYRELCRRWHPDKNPSEVERATALFQFLQQLHERFGDLR